MAAAQKMGCHLKYLLQGSLLILACGGILRADTYYVTLAGLGGEQEYEQRFTGWASEIDKILQGEPGAKIVTLSGPQCTRANIEARLGDIAKQAKPDDSFVLFIIGH